LQTLSLEGTGLTDAGLPELAGLVRLQALCLAKTEVTDAGVKALTGLKGLRTLSLWDTGVRRDGWEELRKALPGCDIYIQDVALVRFRPPPYDPRPSAGDKEGWGPFLAIGILILVAAMLGGLFKAGRSR
jgi:hypothetical protein